MANKSSNTKKEAIVPRKEGFLPFLLAASAMSVVLVALIINKFIFQFNNEPLSPVIAQMLILLVPTYVFLTLTRGRATANQLKELGIRGFGAQHIILVISASFFAICTSFLFNMIFGGVYAAADGFSLFGLFRAGESEFTVSLPYLIVTYAIIPALIEELAFRGFIFSQLRNASIGMAVCISSVISALFFFSPAQIPDALVCSLIFVFVVMTTDSLIASMVVHLVVNLFRLFLQTNMSVYFVSSQNTTLLVITVVLIWLLSGLLFFSEATRIYRERALDTTKNTQEQNAPAPTARERFQDLWTNIKSTFIYKPTWIATTITLVLYVAITVIGYL